jgi:hypothetical protein
VREGEDAGGSIRVIGVTAYRTSAYVDDARESGMETIVSKTRLDDLVARILDGGGARCEPSCENLGSRGAAVGRRTLSSRELDAPVSLPRGKGHQGTGITRCRRLAGELKGTLDVNHDEHQWKMTITIPHPATTRTIRSMTSIPPHRIPPSTMEV